MVEKNVSECCFSFWVVESGEVDVRICECLVGWCKDGKRSISLKCFKQLCLYNSRNKRCVVAVALRSAWNVCRRVCRYQHLVNDVNYTVARQNISIRYRSPIDHDASIYGEGKRCTVCGDCTHAFCNGTRGDISSNDVIEQYVGKDGLSFCSIKRCQIDSSINEGLVRWCKDRERTCSLQRLKKFCLNNSRYERVVISSTLSSSWNVVWGIAWSQDFVNNVDDAVACHNIRGRDVCIVHHHPTVHGEFKRLAIDCVRRHALTDVR